MDAYVMAFLLIGVGILMACVGFIGAGLIVRAQKHADGTRAASDLYHRKFLKDGWVNFASLLRALHDRDGVGIRQAESRFGIMNPVEPTKEPPKSHRGVPQPPPPASRIRPATYGTPSGTTRRG